MCGCVDRVGVSPTEETTLPGVSSEDLAMPSLDEGSVGP